MAQPNYEHVVIIPGILGSSLRYVGPGPYGDRVSRMVWCGDLATIGWTFSVQPHLLATESLESIDVIRDFTLLGASVLPGYGPLIEHLATLGYEVGTTASLFPYDWRRCNFDTARELIVHLEKLVQEGHKRIAIVAHSMGCIVARIALKNAPTATRDSVSRLIQIAPPVRGSAKAYRMLSTLPSLNPILDRIAMLISPHRVANLLAIVRTFESLYQLMPPLDDRILTTVTGEQLSALDRRLWPKDVMRRVRRARTIFAKACGVGVDDVHTIYGVCRPTEGAYLIRDDRSVEKPISVDVVGDGRVTVHSATHDTDPERLIPMYARAATHQALPSCAPVLGAIEALL